MRSQKIIRYLGHIRPVAPPHHPPVPMKRDALIPSIAVIIGLSLANASAANPGSRTDSVARSRTITASANNSHYPPQAHSHERPRSCQRCFRNRHRLPQRVHPLPVRLQQTNNSFGKLRPVSPRRCLAPHSLALRSDPKAASGFSHRKLIHCSNEQAAMA